MKLKGGKIFYKCFNILKFLNLKIKINESELCRISKVEWLKEFLEKKEICANFYPFTIFISLSHTFGDSQIRDIRIIFDKQKIYEQGGKDIDYCDLEYEEVLHIEGITEEIYPKETFKEEIENEENEEEDLENFSYLKDAEKYEYEKEVIIKKITYENGLIKHIYIPKESISEVEFILKNYEIPYSIY